MMPLEVLFKKANDPTPDPRRHNPHVPAQVVDILHLALDKDPNKRFATASALGHAVQQVRPQVVSPRPARQMIWWPRSQRLPR